MFAYGFYYVYCDITNGFSAQVNVTTPHKRGKPIEAAAAAVI